MLLAASSSAASFGSYPVDSEKTTTDLEVSFKLKFFNPGKTDAVVKFSSPDSENYNVSFPDKVRVEASEVTENPSGSGWYHLGDGRYTRVEETSFTVDISRYRSSNNLEIPVTIRASAAGSEGGENTAELIYVHQHQFTAKIDGREPEERNEEDGLDWIEVENKTEVDRKNSSQEASGKRNGSKNYKPGADNTETGGSGVNNVTLVLILGIAVTALYLYRVL